jgi:crotonobetainyl-CoA:carnitine CoA-transferase CaiB-like acyl-CoA transferase
MTAERALRQLWTQVAGVPAAAGPPSDAPGTAQRETLEWETPELPVVTFTGAATLPSAFDVGNFAAAAVGTAGAAIALLSARQGEEPPPVTVDRARAEQWFSTTFRPDGWQLPPAWDAIAGDYPCADGWIRLHTNAPHHRAAALAVLGLPAGTTDRAAVSDLVSGWRGGELEEAIVQTGGCAAEMRSQEQWSTHPQGAAVAAEPLVGWTRTGSADPIPGGPADRPLLGVKVLDLTRVLAGPVATRFLAGYGAEVLRIDPPDWSEPALEPDMTVGKNCARLDLKSAVGMDRLHQLLASADILVHGYRPEALPRLGLGPEELAQRYPRLVSASLDAYGWTGPWSRRRGFDSLVQMSSGIASAGSSYFGTAMPHPLPVQALDHATGYLLAAATVLAWHHRLAGVVHSVRTSLARTAVELPVRLELPADGEAAPEAGIGAMGQPADRADDDGNVREDTVWGPGFRLSAPLSVAGVPLNWNVPARGYGSAEARWK